MAATTVRPTDLMVLDADASRLRLQTTIRLRWFAVTGQLLAVLFVNFGLGFALPIGMCLLFIALSAWLNVFLRVKFPVRHRLGARLVTALLAYDIWQLSALLFLTGGIENPFTVLLVAPVTVSAATLPPRNTVFLGSFALLSSALLIVFHRPLPWFAGQIFDLPTIYKIGAFVGIASCVVFIALYAWRLSKEGRQMSAALAATELVLAREQKLHAIDGLAAAAAHELGTPLGTIVLIAKELERDTPAGSPMAEDLALLKSQAQRCRDILQTLTRKPSENDPLHASLTIGQLIEEAVTPHRNYGIAITIDAGPYVGGESRDTNATGVLSEPVGERRPGLIYGVGNLIENAVEFARSKVVVTTRWNDREVTIVIADDGPGIAPDILETLGEPYVTTRARASASAKTDDTEATGLGLGFFIAKTLLERSGAVVTMTNLVTPATGAKATLTWSRHAFEGTEPAWSAFPGRQKRSPSIAGPNAAEPLT